MPLAPSVILADPDRHLRNVLRVHLGHLGYDVFLAADGMEAAEYARSVLARLVMLDVDLPRYSAYDACAMIRRLPGYDEVPIVLVTTRDLPKVRAAARRASASAVLVKPFSVNALLCELEPFIVDADDPGATAAWQAAAGASRRSAEFRDAPIQVWEPPPKLEWKFGEGSQLTQGKRMLDVLRLQGSNKTKT